ncbi:MAG: septum site-determining protein MinD [Candidatus Muiribacterium halophilum]|uniref:Septum site-determining protein MinD n=1 Tax=Muiribacterium halophilum TaxID=2053465 RepID=A0A2N5ZE36_MUIH1|nr:MAG: septum site-determining protein MinD [Candidatus Muirbacterium halophilum]
MNDMLRSDIGYKTNPDLAKVVTVVSGKGGVGKSTISANLSLGLAMTGQKVVVIDADIGLRNLDIILGYSDRIFHNIIDVIEGECTLSDALIQDKDFPNLSFLPASQIHEKGSLKGKGFSKIIETLKVEYNYIIIDSPAGIGVGLKNLLPITDTALLVVNPDRTSVLDADRTIGVLDDNDVKTTDVVVNRFSIEKAQKEIFLSLDQIKDILGLNILGVVPEDDEISESVNTGLPVIKKSWAVSSKAFINIARRFTGKSIPLLYIFRPSFMKRLLGRIGM